MAFVHLLGHPIQTKEHTTLFELKRWRGEGSFPSDTDDYNFVFKFSPSGLISGPVILLWFFEVSEIV